MNKCRTYLVTDAELFLRCKNEVEDGMSFDDNGDGPDGDLMPLYPATEAEARKELDESAFDACGDMVDAIYFNSSREVLEYAHGADVDLSSFDDDEIEAEAWSIAQNLARYATRYSASDVIIVANDLPVE